MGWRGVGGMEGYVCLKKQQAKAYFLPVFLLFSLSADSVLKQSRDGGGSSEGQEGLEGLLGLRGRRCGREVVRSGCRSKAHRRVHIGTYPDKV